MNNKKIQMSRMWRYFVDATAEIIEDEGIENVTIRKIADKAGYNSATIYNYFSEISHLIFFASMKFLKPYTVDVASYMDKGKNPIEKYLLAWECFCKHSFEKPNVFHAVFVMDLGESPEKLIQDYYKIYPSDLIEIPDGLKALLFERSMSKRGRSILETALKEGYIKEENIDAINELTILVWQGMLTNILNNRRNYDIEDAQRITMKYITEIVNHANLFNMDERTTKSTEAK